MVILCDSCLHPLQVEIMFLITLACAFSFCGYSEKRCSDYIKPGYTAYRVIPNDTEYIYIYKCAYNHIDTLAD